MTTNPKIIIFFNKLFSIKIFENEIVTTILYIISKEVEKFKNRMDNVLNTDI